MSKKSVSKIISIVLILLFALMVFSPYSQANSADKWMDEGYQFIQRGKDDSAIDTKQIYDALMPIGRILVTIATIVLTVVTVVMAIKYMMCDSADKKAKLKTQLIGLVVSTIVIYGAQIIWSILFDFMNNVTSIN